MFEEMIENLKASVRATVLETVQDIADKNFPELLSYSDLKKLLGGIDDTTFGFYESMLEPAKSKCGKGTTRKSFKWSKELVIKIINEPRNLQIQRRGK
ncbi:hypothetical protein [Lactococcus garvieae]|uniref:hypothetical protein n=1 Tax=Lactococcus garvieae TaxID=1363 RepID=UPI002550455C|nr:hypothetical protein [Lactococcus garvieae]